MPLISFKKDETRADQSAGTITLPGATCTDIVHACYPNSLGTLIAKLDESEGCVHFITDGKWSLYDYLLAELERRDHTCQVWVTTYSMTELSARILAKLKDSGKISQLHLLMDYKSKMRYPQVDQLIRNVATSIGLVHIHAKVLVIKDTLPTNQKASTLIGSANWTRNPRIEVGVVDTTLRTALAHIDWIENEIRKSNGTGT